MNQKKKFEAIPNLQKIRNRKRMRYKIRQLIWPKARREIRGDLAITPPSKVVHAQPIEFFTPRNEVNLWAYLQFQTTILWLPWHRRKIKIWTQLPITHKTCFTRHPRIWQLCNPKRNKRTRKTMELWLKTY